MLFELAVIDVGELAERAIGFAALTAGAVMTPRTSLIGIARDAGIDELRDLVLEHPHSRLPVFETDWDDVVGYVLYKDLLRLVWQERLIVLRDLVRPAIIASESTPAVDLLHQMRARRTQLAIVLDEEGGTAGIVTLDDLIEELVGEVFGELNSGSPASITRCRTARQQWPARP